jgi:hypothetical protein
MKRTVYFRKKENDPRRMFDISEKSEKTNW